MRSPATIAGALLITALGVGLTSCAKTPPDSEEPPAAGRNVSSWQEVRIYSGADQPRCAYVGVGRVKGERGGMSVRARLRHAVYNAGGDAVIEVTSIYDRSRDLLALEGLAIRFTDPECTH
jgi:hypothetical protein